MEINVAEFTPYKMIWKSARISAYESRRYLCNVRSQLFGPCSITDRKRVKVFFTSTVCLKIGHGWVITSHSFVWGVNSNTLLHGKVYNLPVPFDLTSLVTRGKHTHFSCYQYFIRQMVQCVSKCVICYNTYIWHLIFMLKYLVILIFIKVIELHHNRTHHDKWWQVFIRNEKYMNINTYIRTYIRCRKSTLQTILCCRHLQR